MIVGYFPGPRITAFSITTQQSPIRTGAPPCAVTTAPGKTTVPAPTSTSPDTTALGATRADGATVGLLPACSTSIVSLRGVNTCPYCPKTRPTVTPPDSSSATGRPSGRDNESRRDRPREEPAQSNRCRGPGDYAPRGSAPL